MRVAGLLAALVLALGMTDAAAHAGGDAGPTAHAAKKKRCKKRGKHHHRHHRSGCHRTSAGGGGIGAAGEVNSNTGTPATVAGRESEYAIVLSRPSVACGRVTVQQVDNGEDPHDLQLWRAGEPGPPRSRSASSARACTVSTRTFTLSRGTWTLFCSLPGHYEAGMHVNLTVELALVGLLGGRLDRAPRAIAVRGL